MVRPFGLRDVTAIRQLQPLGVAFDLRRLLLRSLSPVSAALLDYVTHHRFGAITCVQPETNSSQRRGFVQAVPRANGMAWDLVFLSPSLEFHPDAAHVWHSLLHHLALYGTERAVQRIYARSAEDAEAEDVLRHVGFTSVTREEVFVLAQQPGPAPVPRGMRRVEPQDSWALDQLHRHVVPPQVQQSEGLHQRWCGRSAKRRIGAHPTDEFVWADRGNIVAYLGLCSSPRGYWLDVVVSPDHRADLLPYIRSILMLAQCSHYAPVYCNVPDYAVGLGWLLRTVGFETYARQIVMVRHTVARVPVRRPIMLPALEQRVDVGTPVGHVSIENRAP